MEETLTIFRENFEQLPAELRSVIVDPNTIEKIAGVCEKLSLTPEQTAHVENETFFILFGIEPLNHFRTNLVENSGIKYDQAIKIYSDINTSVFGSVIEILKQIDSLLNGNPIEENSNEEKETVVLEQKEETVRLIPDHDELVRTEGPHLHSQNTMPSPRPQVQTSPAPHRFWTKTAPNQAPSQVTSTKPTVDVAPKNESVFKSIVDQKLGGVVRSASSIYGFQAPAGEKEAAPTPKAETPKPASSYNGNDPYREPIA